MTRKAETRTTRAHARARAGRTRRGFAWSMIIALAVVSLSSSAWIPAIHAAFTGTTNSTASFSFASSFGGTNVVDTTTDVVDGTTTSVAALLAAKGADGKISLREAVTAANNSAASGPYTFTMIAGTFTRPSGLNISSSLTLQGASTATTIISGGGAVRPFSSSGPNVTLQNLTITNGSSGSNGGALRVNSGNMTLDSVAVTNSTASASQAGAIYFQSGGALTITNSTLQGNIASAGGSPFNGGAIYQTAGSLTMTTSTISNNTASSGGDGGGIWAGSGVSSVILTNVTITGNIASTGSGGGLWLAATTSTLTNTTIVTNSQTSGSGAGLYLSAGTVTIRNTIIANNTGGNCAGTITTAGYNLDSANTCSFSAGTDLRNTNPNLATLANNGGPTNTIALNAGSPAINTGTTTSAPTTDQRAGPRVGATDIGAYEYGSTPP